MKKGGTYYIEEADSFTTLHFFRPGWLEIKMYQVDRGGRFFSVNNPAWDEPPKLSLS